MNEKAENHIYKKLCSKHGISAIETICIAGFAIITVLALSLSLLHYRNTMRTGNDNHLVLTAERAAMLNMAGSDCIVKDCNGKEGCDHIKGGVSTGYLDHVSNSIVGELPEGYNEANVMTIRGKQYEGKKGTMVIKVEYDGSQITLSWVKGK